MYNFFQHWMIIAWKSDEFNVFSIDFRTGTFNFMNVTQMPNYWINDIILFIIIHNQCWFIKQLITVFIYAYADVLKENPFYTTSSPSVRFRGKVGEFVYSRYHLDRFPNYFPVYISGTFQQWTLGNEFIKMYRIVINGKMKWSKSQYFSLGPGFR